MERQSLSRAEQLDVCRIGNLNGFDGGSFAGQVFDSNGIAPTLTDMQGGGRQPHIVEVNKMDEIKQIANVCIGSLQEHAAIKTDGICTTLTEAMGQGGGQVPMIDEVIAIDEQNKCIRDDVFGALTTDGSSPKHNNRVGEIKKIKIRQATKDGFIDLELPGLADLEYPNSNTRRGRVVDRGHICHTLTTENIPSLIELADEEFWNFLYEIDGEIYLIRIRKLTPKECWSLMDFNEGSFEKAEKVNSNTQLYKQAGNSIVVNVLVAVFGQLFEGKENFYKDI